MCTSSTMLTWRALAEDGEDLLGVHRTFDQLGADLDVVAVGNLERHALGDLVGDRLDHAVFLRCAGIGVRGQDDLATAIVLHDLDAAANSVIGASPFGVRASKAR